MRLALYVLAWIGCSLVIAGCWAVLGVLAVFVTVLGPFACLYAGARLGTWWGWGFPATAALMLAGLGLFASVHPDLCGQVGRRQQALGRLEAAAAALRADLWRRYRRGIPP